MATLSEDNTSYRCRSIMRRDFRHDPGLPETESLPYRGKRKRRKHIKGCKHSYTCIKHSVGTITWTSRRCIHCGKSGYSFLDNEFYPRSVPDPIPYDQKLIGSTWEIVERKKEEASAD